MIPFAKPNFDPKSVDFIVSNIENALHSGMLTNSRYVREVEERFRGMLNKHYVSATNSCTASLHLAMILSGVKRGDEVIVPSNTFVSTANAVLYCGGTPVFAEINEHTLNIDCNDIEKRITDRTKAVIPVHLLGKPCEMDSILKTCKDHGLVLIEDCAHAHGAYYKKQPCGTFGDYACFSFYPTKFIAGAEGGLLVSSDPDRNRLASILLNQGRAGTGPNDVTDLGYNYRMNELQAIIVLSHMNQLDTIVEERTHLAQAYRRILDGRDDVMLIEEDKSEVCSFYSFAIRVASESRDWIRDELLKGGIETSIMYHPVHLQPIYRKMFGYKSGSLPITEKVCSEIINLPLYNGMTYSQVDEVCDRLETILRNLHNAV